MLASGRTTARAVQPLLTLATITLLGVAVAADVTGLLSPASVWGELAVGNLTAAILVAVGSLVAAVATSLGSATSTPVRRADFMRDLILFAAVVSATVSLVLRLRAESQLPASAAVMSALTALAIALVAAFFETD